MLLSLHNSTGQALLAKVSSREYDNGIRLVSKNRRLVIVAKDKHDISPQVNIKVSNHIMFVDIGDIDDKPKLSVEG